MKNHPWLRSLDTTAYCPKCGAPRLRHSHARSVFERYRKNFTEDRLFRCFECGWRGWMDDAKLRYVVRRDDIPKIPIEADQDEIPLLDLEVNLDELARPRRKTARTVKQKVDEISLTGDHEKDPAADQSKSRSRTAKRTPPIHDIEIEDGKISPVEGRLQYRPVDEDYHSTARYKERPCPKCHDYRLYRSHADGALEIIRKTFSRMRPYRCHSCGWRGWLPKAR